LQQGASVRTWLHQRRALRERHLLGQATEIDFAVRAWIHFRGEALTGRGDIVHEQRLRWERGRPSNNIAVMECQIELRYISSSAILNPFLEAETDEAILERG